MKKKYFLAVVLCIVGSQILAGCGDDAVREGAKEDSTREKEVQEDIPQEDEVQGGTTQDAGEEADTNTDVVSDNPGNKNDGQADQGYRVGDAIELVTDDGGSLELTVTDWGGEYDQLFDEIKLYVEYEVTNTGSTTLQVGNAMFNVYADNYVVEQSFGEDDVTLAELSSGRSVRGRLYADVNPDYADVIELEIGDVVIILKDGSTQDYGEDEYFYNNYLDVVSSIMLDYGEECEYALYDMDNDGTDELIVSYGNSNADWVNSVWTTDGYGVIYVGDFYLPVMYCEVSDGIGIDAVYVSYPYQSVERITKVGNTLYTESVWEGDVESEDSIYEVGEAIPTYYVSDDSALR